MFQVGQAVLGKIRFADGQMPQYKRTYLVINVKEDYIELLNVSSIKGKEHKLLYPTNLKITKYNPPFMKPSFVKLDSLVKVHQNEYDQLKVLCDSKLLDEKELNGILEAIKNK